MTTAHRPTWKAAVGQSNEGGWNAGGSTSHQASALDMPGHTQLKVRHQTVQASVEALQQAEEEAKKTRKQILQATRPMDPENEKRAKLKLLKQTAEIDVEKLKAKYDDSDIDDGGGGSEESDLDDDDSDLDDSSDDDDEDDEAALQAELAKIRAEREDAKLKAAEQEENEKETAAAVLGNPLLNSTATVESGRLKRRWNDDVVFRNQAKNETSNQPKKRFINDTVRNDFHKRFLNKFIR